LAGCLSIHRGEDDIDTEKISCPIIRTDEHAFRGLAIWRPQHAEAVAHAHTVSDRHRFSWKSNRLKDTREQESDLYRRTEAAVDPLEHRQRNVPQQVIETNLKPILQVNKSAFLCIFIFHRGSRIFVVRGRTKKEVEKAREKYPEGPRKKIGLAVIRDEWRATAACRCCHRDP